MIQHSVVTLGGQTSLTALIGGRLYVATNSNPNFEEIKARVEEGDESVASEFNIGNAINSAFGDVTDRVTVNEDGVLLDGEPVTGSISAALIELVREAGGDGARSLARFLERLSANPSHRSRQQLYSFIDANGINIDEDGYLMLYKGVQSDGNGGYQSVAQGTAWVNGERFDGHIPAKVGDVITMPRSEVSDDPNVACHAGLHAAARDYAEMYARQGTMLTMRVDPADVVSVPADYDEQKMRVCRYEVVELDTEVFRSILWTPTSYVEDEDYEDDDYEYSVDDDYTDQWSGAYDDDDEWDEPCPCGCED